MITKKIDRIIASIIGGIGIISLLVALYSATIDADPRVLNVLGLAAIGSIASIFSVHITKKYVK